MQFPVSSGQHHRIGEEWRPVSPSPVANSKTGKVVPKIVVSTIPTSSIPLPPDPSSISTLDSISTETTTQPQSEKSHSSFPSSEKIQSGLSITTSSNVSKEKYFYLCNF